MNDDTHDKLVQTYLEYFKANEQFERGPSLRTKRNARELLRKIRDLAKVRQTEIKEKYDLNLIIMGAQEAGLVANKIV